MKLSKHVNKESKPGKLVWHKGPPPHIGWWNASTLRDSEVWRWWDGKAWSWSIHRWYSGGDAKTWATYKEPWSQPFIKWNDSYPKNARVPRYDPRG